MVVVVVFNGYIFNLLLKPSTDSSMEQKFPVSAKISAHTHQRSLLLRRNDKEQCWSLPHALWRGAIFLAIMGIVIEGIYFISV